ncbi:MAG: hypothetical protein AAF127_16140 [Pseudomonadota bacterium]
MALSQTQIIQSLGEALAWFEKELSWGVSESELNHLTGRIGELYAAMITRGQMALKTNQHGYDVISAENERISVKTITTSSHVSFRKSTLDQVDRAIILRLNTDPDEGISIEEIFDEATSVLIEKTTDAGDVYRFNVRSSRTASRPLEDLRERQRCDFENYQIRQYENGKIVIFVKGERSDPAKPHLREIAAKIGVELASEGGRLKTTHQLGSNVLKQLIELQA